MQCVHAQQYVDLVQSPLVDLTVPGCSPMDNFSSFVSDTGSLKGCPFFQDLVQHWSIR